MRKILAGSPSARHTGKRTQDSPATAFNTHCLSPTRERLIRCQRGVFAVIRAVLARLAGSHLRLDGLAWVQFNELERLTKAEAEIGLC